MNSLRQEILNRLEAKTGHTSMFAIPREMIKFLGSWDAAILLSQLLYWDERCKKAWIYKTDKDWQEELLFTRWQFDTARNRLKELGLIETKVRKANGAPTNHYRIAGEVLLPKWDEFLTNFQTCAKRINGIAENQRDGGHVDDLQVNMLATDRTRTLDYDSRLTDIYKGTDENEFSDSLSSNPEIQIPLDDPSGLTTPPAALPAAAQAAPDPLALMFGMARETEERWEEMKRRDKAINTVAAIIARHMDRAVPKKGSPAWKAWWEAIGHMLDDDKVQWNTEGLIGAIERFYAKREYEDWASKAVTPNAISETVLRIFGQYDGRPFMYSSQ